METTELLFHPVRLRIVQAGHHGRTFSTAELATLLPDVSTATLYRHVAVLADGGLLEVVSEQRVRGAVERRYRIRDDRAVVDEETAAGMSIEDHRRGFATVVAVLLAEFDAYLSRPGADPVADKVGYRQISVWLTDREKADLVDEVVAAIRRRTGNVSGEGRRRHLLTPVLFPAEGSEESAG